MTRRVRSPYIEKIPTGIDGLDDPTYGGLPRGRVTLLSGGAGSGKTILGLQALVHGARSCNEPGLLVTFEENASRLMENVSAFGWGLPSLHPRKLSILDAKLDPAMVVSGKFDLSGVIAQIAEKVRGSIGRGRATAPAGGEWQACKPEPAPYRRWSELCRERRLTMSNQSMPEREPARSRILGNLADAQTVLAALGVRRN